MVHPHNPFFVGRQAELECFAHLLTTGEPLTILNVHGHSGVGKTWLLEEFHRMCRGAEVPFASLDPHRLHSDPVELLTGFANRLELNVNWGLIPRLFDMLLPEFLDALARVPASSIVLMLDTYDQMFNFDPWVRHLIRGLTQLGSSTGPALQACQTAPWHRVVIVISSQAPLSERWPLDPIYRRPLQEMELRDFTLSEACDYFTRIGIPREHHVALFRLTQGYPLALALVATLETPEALTASLDASEPSEILDMEWKILSPDDRKTLVQKILERALYTLDDEPLRAQVVALLRASAVVRRFDQSLLATMLDQSALPDALFDWATALSMVVERTQVGKTRTFMLHDALRMALLEDAEGRGLGKSLRDYRRRALASYVLQQAEPQSAEAIAELMLDTLFLHSNPAIRSLFFDQMLPPLLTGSASFDELGGVLQLLMRQNPLYREIDFDGEPLERLIRETRDWLSLDRQLHGETLRYFQVVRRSDAHGDVAGFVLNVPVTDATLSLLRRDTVGTVYEASVGPIALRENERRYFSLRLVAGDWDVLSALIRALFVQLTGQPFDTLATVVPWPLISMLAEELGFDVLARGVEYEGHRYTALQLDVAQHGGPVRWLLQLVRGHVGLPARRLAEDWGLFKEVLQEALERLQGSFALLAKSPLIDEFGLADPGATDWERAQALTETLQAVLEAMRSPPAQDRSDSVFHVLNESYGIVGDAWRRFAYGSQPSVAEICQRLHCTKGTYFNRRKEALEALARAFRRQLEGS